MYPRIWPIQDICIGRYVLKRLLTVRHILEKVMSIQHSFEEFSEKQRRVELKSVGNFVSKTVLVESANKFSLEELCRTQYSLTYFFRSHIDHQTYGKTLTLTIFTHTPWTLLDITNLTTNIWHINIYASKKVTHNVLVYRQVQIIVAVTCVLYISYVIEYKE